MRFLLAGDPAEFSDHVASLTDAGHECIPLLGPQDEAAASEVEFGSLDISEVEDCDAALLGRGLGDVVARRLLLALVDHRVPVLAVPALLADPLDYYEIDARREESNGLVLVDRPLRWAAGAQQLAEIVRGGEAGPLGLLEQVVVEREGPELAADWSAALASDVDLIRAIAGDVDELVALGGLNRPGERLIVQFQGADGWAGRWEAKIAESPSLTVSIEGRAGQARWERRLEGDFLQAPGADGEPLRESSASPVVLREFLKSVAEQTPGRPDWMDDCRALEIAGGVARSLARGRKVDVRFQRSSEMDNFKSLMAATGCGLLLVVPVVLVAAGATAFAANQGQAGWADAVLKWTPLVVLAVLLLFLALQAAVFLAPREPESEENGRDAGRAD